jgi:hypothetical protein
VKNETFSEYVTVISENPSSSRRALEKYLEPGGKSSYELVNAVLATTDEDGSSIIF